jgi:ATP-dependent protease HslVU (ClpYQ) peptidase subunit
VTTIVGAVTDTHTIIAGDIRITDPTTGKYWDSELTPKIGQRGPFLYGVAGDKHIVDRIIYSWDPDGLELSGDPVLDVVTLVQPSLKECVGDLEGEWAVLLGYMQTLFEVSDKDATHSDKDQFAAIGSGAAYALGHLSMRGVTSYRDLRMTVAIAARYDMHTSSMSLHVEAPHDS